MTDRITLNVGGRTIQTTRTTLNKAPPNTLLSSMFSSSNSSILKFDADGTVFLDADPDIFGHILEYLRRNLPFEGGVSPSKMISNDEWKANIDYFGLLPIENVPEEQDEQKPQMTTKKIKPTMEQLTITIEGRRDTCVTALYEWLVDSDEFKTWTKSPEPEFKIHVLLSGNSLAQCKPDESLTQIATKYEIKERDIIQWLSTLCFSDQHAIDRFKRITGCEIRRNNEQYYQADAIRWPANKLQIEFMQNTFKQRYPVFATSLFLKISG